MLNRLVIVSALLLLNGFAVSAAQAANADCQAGNTCGGGGHQQAVGYSFLPSQGGIAFSDNGLLYQPSYGPAIDTTVRLMEEEKARSGVTSVGEFRLNFESYVTAAEGEAESGMVRLYERGGGYQTYRLPMGVSCAEGAGSACAYERHAVEDNELLRMRGGEVPGSMGLSALTLRKVNELLARLPVSERQHAYVRRVGDGTVEVYGTTRGVAGGYEMWLSAVVDEKGLSIELEYDTRVAGLFRLSRIKDASGLSVRVYYPDTEPSSGAAFADESLSAGLLAIWRELPVGGKSLVTSMVDPYGNRWRMDYADATSGVRLRGLEEMLQAAMSNPNQGVTYAAAVLQMNHPRLVRLIDAVGVESRIEWGCGSSGGDLAADSAELSRRVASLTAHLGCLGDLESGQVEDGVRPLYRRVSSTTVVGYGTTRYSRLWHSEGELIKGWVVENAQGELQRMETRFNTTSAEAQSWMSEYLEGRGRYMGMGMQHPEVMGDRPPWVNASYGQFWGLITNRNRLVTQELLFRNSMYWGPKALAVMRTSGWTPARIRNVEERLELDKAEWTHYLHDYVPGQDGPVLSSLVMATHHVGEDSWTWVAYPNQKTENSYRESGSNAGASGEVKGVPGLRVKMVETPTGRQAQTSYVEYNERWNPVRVWDAVGRKQEMEYAGNGRDAIALRVLPVEGTTGSAQEMVRMGYNDRRQVVWERDVRGNVSCYQYRDTAPYEGTSVKVPLGSSSYTADPQSACQDATRQVLSSTLSITRTRAPLWTVDGTHPWTESDPQGPVLSVMDVVSRDGFGIEHRSHYEQGMVVEASGEGKTLRYEGRDAFGRPTDVLVNGQLQAHYTYEALHVHQVTDGEGRQIEYGVDALGRVQTTSERDAAGSTLSETRVEYDASGGILSYSKGTGMGGWEMPQVTFSYEVSGRPVSRTQQDGIISRIEYQPYSGKVAAVVNALERRELDYNVDGSVAQSRVLDAAMTLAAPARQVVYSYRDGSGWDRYGRLLSLTDNGHVRHYHYRTDDPGKLLDGDQPVVDSLGSEGTRVTTRIGDYDALGRVTGWQMDNALGDRELVESLSFDRHGRVEKIATDEMMVRASYEPIPIELGAATPGPGALESAMPGLPQEVYGALKRLSYDLNRDGSVEATQTIDRYGVGEIHARALKSRNYYLDGRTPDATSDGLTPMAPSVKRSFQYTASGKIKEIGGFADGSIKSYEYDGVGALSRMSRYQGGAWQRAERYEYDQKGNRLGIFETDALGTRQKQGGEYGVSNRIRTYRSWVDKQPLTCGNLEQQSHDRLGRLTADPTRCEKGNQISYTWDHEGNLTRIQKDAGNFIDLTYQWDGHVQTRRETQSGSVTKDWSYVWVGNQLRQIRDNQHGQRLVMSFNGDGYKTYTYDPSGTLIDEKVTLLLRDHLGSLIGTADQTGTLQQTITYDDNGNVEEHRLRNPVNGQLEVNPGATMASIGIPFGYAGYMPLTDNLYLTHHRVYHTVLGRWISQDPIGEMGGQNLYQYVFNDPIAMNDLSGLVPRNPERCAEELENLRRLAYEQIFSLEDQISEIERRHGTYSSGNSSDREWARNMVRFLSWSKDSIEPDAIMYRNLKGLLKERENEHNARRGLMYESEQRLREYCGDDDDNGPAEASNVYIGEWAEDRMGARGSNMENRAFDVGDARDGFMNGFGDPILDDGGPAPSPQKAAAELGILIAAPLIAELALGGFLVEGGEALGLFEFAW